MIEETWIKPNLKQFIDDCKNKFTHCQKSGADKKVKIYVLLQNRNCCSYDVQLKIVHRDDNLTEQEKKYYSYAKALLPKEHIDDQIKVYLVHQRFNLQLLNTYQLVDHCYDIDELYILVKDLVIQNNKDYFWQIKSDTTVESQQTVQSNKKIESTSSCAMYLFVASVILVISLSFYLNGGDFVA